MHRSGTSLMARLLNLLGADLGPSEELMAARPDNPKGFWEPVPLVRISDHVLDRLGGSWDDPPVLPEGWAAQHWLKPYRERARSLCEDLFGPADRLADEDALVAWKDPRAALLFEFWRSVLPVSRLVVCVRDPREVAASLQARNGLSDEQAARLWLRYTTDAASQDLPLLVVDHPRPFEDLSGLLDEVATFLGVDIDDEQARAVREFVDPDLRRAEAEGSPPDRGPMAAAYEFYTANILGGSTRWTDLAMLLRRSHVGSETQEHLARLTGELAQLRSELEDARAKLEACDSGRERMQRRLDRLEAELSASETERLRVTAQLRRIDIQHEALEAARRQQERLQRRLDEAERIIDELRSRMAASDEARGAPGGRFGFGNHQ